MQDAKSCRCCRYIWAGANFWAILGHFWAILAIWGHFWAILGHCWAILGSFRSFLGHFLVLIFCGKICLCANLIAFCNSETGWFVHVGNQLEHRDIMADSLIMMITDRWWSFFKFNDVINSSHNLYRSDAATINLHRNLRTIICRRRMMIIWSWFNHDEHN